MNKQPFIYLAHGSADWQFGLSMAGQFFRSLLGSLTVVSSRAFLGITWLWAAVPGATAPCGFITQQASLGLFIVAQHSKNHKRESPSVGKPQCLKASPCVGFVNDPLAKESHKTNPDLRDGEIGSVSL